MNHIVKVTERGMKQLQAAVKNGCGRKTGNAFGNEVMEKIHKQDFYSFEGCDFINLDTYKKIFNHEKNYEKYFEDCLKEFLNYLNNLDYEKDCDEIIEGIEEILFVTEYGDKKRVALKYQDEIDKLKKLLFKEENYKVIEKEDTINIASDYLNFKDSSCDIKLCDLLKELANINKANIIYTALEIVPSFKDNDINNIKDLNEKMKYWGTNLKIIYDNDYKENYLYLHLFNSVQDLQNDGKTLLEHASFRKTPEGTIRVIVNKNMDDIICHFDLEYAFNNDEYFNCEKGIGKAILNCINKGKVMQTKNVAQQLKLSL